MLGKKVNILLLTLLTLLSTAVSAAVNTQYNATVCGSGTYLFGCKQLTSSGTETNTLGDSTVTLHLLFAPLKATSYTATIEPGQTYLFGCQQLTADTVTSNTLQQIGCGCDSTVTLTLKVQAPAPTKVVVGYTATIQKGETYLFGCATYASDTTVSDTLHLAGKDSIVVLTLKVEETPVEVKVGYTATIQKGETYLFGCATYASDTTVSDTLHLAGKDSIVVLTLKVEETPAPVEVKVGYTAAIKTGETYLFGCAQLTASGTYSDTLHLAGKDSIVFVNLTVAPAIDTVKVQYDAAIKTGETYLFGCAQLTASGTYSDTLHLAGKDSIVFVNLTVAPAIDTVKVQYNTEITVGDIYLFGCKTYQYTETGSQVLTDTLHLAGKDSIVFVNLTVSAGGGGQGDTAVAYTATIKPGQTYLFGCQQLTSPGTYYDTLPRVNLIGDSAIVLTLVNEVKVGYDATIKQGETYLFGCQQFTVDTVYADTLHMAGKDSITVLTLTVEPVCPAVIVVGDTAAAVCEKDLPFIWHGLTLNADTVCEDTLHNATALGCDSIARLTFTVIKPVTGNDSIEGCDSVTYKGITYKASAIAYDTTTSVLTGCDSIVTMKIIVKQHAIGNDSIEGCDTVTFKGIKYTADAIVYDTIIGGATNGCDSIVTMKIIVKQHATGDDAMDGCDTVTFKGIKYTADAIAYDTIVGGAANGCDSIVTMTITVHHTDSSTLDSIDTCNMYTWHGVRYTKTGIYYDTLQTVHGCDSICKLDLTITLPYQDTLTLEHYYGDRVIMINRHEINALGWKLDSLDLDHPEYVKWYRINAPGDTTFLDNGYYYTLTSGEPLPAGTYYAVIDIEPTGGARCGGKGVTEEYTVKGAAPAPALMPSLARPGQDIRIVNLNPMVQTNVRIYSADGLVQGSYTVSGEESYTIKAAGTTGFYLVELYNEGMKSTLRYIVK